MVTLRPDVTFSGERVPSLEELHALHHRAHEECFIANSVRTEIRCEPVPIARSAWTAGATGRAPSLGEEGVQPGPGDPRDLPQRFLELVVPVALDAPGELAQDTRAVVTLDSEDEREAELGIVGGVERGQARELVRRAFVEARPRLLQRGVGRSAGRGSRPCPRARGGRESARAASPRARPGPRPSSRRAARRCRRMAAPRSPAPPPMASARRSRPAPW